MILYNSYLYFFRITQEESTYIRTYVHFMSPGGFLVKYVTNNNKTQ